MKDCSDFGSRTNSLADMSCRLLRQHSVGIATNFSQVSQQTKPSVQDNVTVTS